MLVDRAVDFVGAEGGDDPLDLPPVAEFQDIAGIAAGFGTHRCLQAGIVAEPVDQFRCVGKRRPSSDIRSIHASFVAQPPFPTADKCRQQVVDHDDSPAMAQAGFRWQRRRMATRKPQAGGFLIFAAIIVGLVWGIATGQATRGALFGTIAGIALATLLWLVDRRRQS